MGCTTTSDYTSISPAQLSSLIEDVEGAWRGWHQEAIATARGNSWQKTFLDGKDYQAFVDGLGELKRTTLFSVYARLMPNHFHPLIATQRLPLSVIVQKLLTRYVGSFNFRSKSSKSVKIAITPCPH